MYHWFLLISPKFLERKLNLTIIPPKKDQGPPPPGSLLKKVPHDRGRKSTWISPTKNELIIHHPSHPSNLDANLFSEVWWKKMWRSGPFVRQPLVGRPTHSVFVSFRSRKRRCRGALFSPAFFCVPCFYSKNSICFYLIHPPKFCSAHPTSSVLVSHRYLQIHQTFAEQKCGKNTHWRETAWDHAASRDVLMPIPFLYKETKGINSKKGPGKSVWIS